MSNVGKEEMLGKRRSDEGLMEKEMKMLRKLHRGGASLEG